MCIRTPVTGDDQYFSTVSLPQLPSFLRARYASASSRMLIEAGVVFFLRMPFWVWMICNCAIITLAAYAVQQLAAPRSLLGGAAACLSMLLLDISSIGEAGWIATSLNHLWPCALAGYGLAGLKEASRPDGRLLYLRYGLAMLAAASSEVCAAVLFGLALTTFLRERRQEHCTLFSRAMLLMLGLCLLAAFLCPGNQIRYGGGMTGASAGYAALNLWDKLLLTLLNAFASIIFTGGWPVWLLAFMLPFATLWRSRSLSPKIRAFLPLTLLCLFTVGISDRLAASGWAWGLSRHLYSFMLSPPQPPRTADGLLLAFIAAVFFYSLCWSATRLVWRRRPAFMPLALPAGIWAKLAFSLPAVTISANACTLLPFVFACLLVTVRVIRDGLYWRYWKLPSALLACAACISYGYNLMQLVG